MRCSQLNLNDSFSDVTRKDQTKSRVRLKQVQCMSIERSSVPREREMEEAQKG